ncbi:MAG: PKD domain-containing protein [Deltaproteobacteria bacterium]|nr:PKD domain-containing protein [Deltaproteobacteria bacterium]
MTKRGLLRQRCAAPGDGLVCHRHGSRTRRRPSGQCFRRFRHMRPVAGLLLLTLTVAEGIRFSPPQAWAVASQISSITPSCADVGEPVTITGNGFGAQNVTITVGGVVAPLVNAYGNRVTFLVPAGASPGITTVTATNPGGQVGSIAFRVKRGEICGNQVDEDCDSQIDDPDVCAPVIHAPIAYAGADQTAPVGTTVPLDGTASSDPDGNPLSFQWMFVSKPADSTAPLTGAATPTPSLTIDKPGTYTVQLLVSDGSLSSAPDTVVISTINSAPVASAGPDQSAPVGTIISLNGSASTDVDGDPLTYQWAFLARPLESTATLSEPTAVTPSFTIDKAGDYLVQLIVHDGTVSSEPDTVTISTLNSPPVADAGPDKSGQVGETVTLDGTGSHDVDGNPLTYLWGLVAKPSGSTATLTTPPHPGAQPDAGQGRHLRGAAGGQ